MTPEDLTISREVRRWLDKRLLDTSVAQVSSNKGFVALSGQVRALRSAKDVNVKEEIELFHKQITRAVPNVKGVSYEWRVILQEKKVKEHEGEPQGTAGTAPTQGPTNTTHRPGQHRH